MSESHTLRVPPHAESNGRATYCGVVWSLSCTTTHSHPSAEKLPTANTVCPMDESGVSELYA